MILYMYLHHIYIENHLMATEKAQCSHYEDD